MEAGEPPSEIEHKVMQIMGSWTPKVCKVMAMFPLVLQDFFDFWDPDLSDRYSDKSYKHVCS